MAAAVGSAGVFISDILNAREDRILSRKLQKYEHLQDVMVEHLNLNQQLVERLKKNLAIAKDVIDQYKNSVVPSWEEGVKGLRAEIAQLTQDKQAAEAQVKTLALELGQAKQAAEAQGRDLKDTKLLYNASLRMAQDLKQDGEASEARAAEGPVPNGGSAAGFGAQGSLPGDLQALACGQSVLALRAGDAAAAHRPGEPLAAGSGLA